MKGSKVITIIGIFIMVLVAASYILFEAFVQDTSNITAQNVVVAKGEVPEGTVIHNVEEARAYFTVKRVSSDDVVCPECGCAVQPETDQSVSVGLVILSVLLPLFGLIYWAVKAKVRPKCAKVCGIAAIISWALSFLLGFLTAFI